MLKLAPYYIGADRIRNFKPDWTRPDQDEMIRLARPDRTGSGYNLKLFKFYRTANSKILIEKELPSIK
jgi:hypothetical protein